VSEPGDEAPELQEQDRREHVWTPPQQAIAHYWDQQKAALLEAEVTAKMQKHLSNYGGALEKLVRRPARSRVDLAKLETWTIQRTTDPRLPMLKLESVAGGLRFWVLPVPFCDPALSPEQGCAKEAYVQSVTCCQLDLRYRGFAFESATELRHDPDRGRRLALERALKLAGASRTTRLALWVGYDAFFGKR
jgi:hypothetical protein